MNKKNVEAIAKNQCMGCSLCRNICPVNAISMIEDSEGFEVPKIDEGKCVSCGICYNKCITQRDDSRFATMKKAYAVWARDKNIRINSTSGGAYYVIAKAFIDNGGYICACAFDDNLEGASHVIGNCRDVLAKTARSKYFQSKIGTVYLSVKTLLDKGEKVLFVGTPCQVDALNVFLGKPYSSLLTCDFVCRGVNSRIAFKEYIKYLEEVYNSKARNVHFKNKKTGWKSLATHVYFENGREYHGDKFRDPWINGYIVGHFFMRQSCYDCKYTSPQRSADITFGDLWGYEKLKQNEFIKGVSFLTLNTSRGSEFFSKICDLFEISEISVTEIQNGNGCLNGASIDIPKERKKFFERCNEERFDRLVFRLLMWDKDTQRAKCKMSKIFTMKNIIKNPQLIFEAHRIKENMEDVIDG